MVLVVYNQEQHVFLINFNHMTILLKMGVLVALIQSWVAIFKQIFPALFSRLFF